MIFFLLLILTSIVFALFEIQIEGKDGWANNIPTWKINTKPNNFKPIRIILDPNKPITGYHLYLWLFIILLVHLPLTFYNWGLKNEIFIISFLLYLSTVEDFLWFVLNPFYGIKKFKKEYVPWHTYWFLKIPAGYWIALPAATALYILGSVL
jgi:hypothetical protein